MLLLIALICCFAQEPTAAAVFIILHWVIDWRIEFR